MRSKEINWLVAPFLVVTSTIALGTLVWYAFGAPLPWQTVALFTFMLFATGMSITAGYHRLFSHRSYEASSILRWFVALFGAGAFQGSILVWASDHRTHHAQVDTERDPYNINQGFWHAHILWLVFKRPIDREFKNCPDLKKDALVVWQHRYFFPLSAIMCFGFPAAVASLWGDALGGLLFAGFVRVVVNHHFTFFINSLCHYVGSQPYSDRHTARDSWITALFTYGEGYHNFHHEFAADYRNGIRYYAYDPTKWLIRGLSYLGLTWDLRRINPQLILDRKLEMDQKRLTRSLEHHPEPLAQKAHELIVETRKQLARAAAQLQTLRAEYAELRAASAEKVSHRLTELKARLIEAKREVQSASRAWARLPQTLQALLLAEKTGTR